MCLKIFVVFLHIYVKECTEFKKLVININCVTNFNSTETTLSLCVCTYEVKMVVTRKVRTTLHTSVY